MSGGKMAAPNTGLNALGGIGNALGGFWAVSQNQLSGQQAQTQEVLRQMLNAAPGEVIRLPNRVRPSDLQAYGYPFPGLLGNFVPRPKDPIAEEVDALCPALDNTPAFVAPELPWYLTGWRLSFLKWIERRLR